MQIRFLAIGGKSLVGFLCVLLLSGCYYYRAQVPGAAGRGVTDYESEVVWSLAWGLARTNPRVANCQGQALAEVRTTTRHRDHTCVLEFDGPLSQRTRTYLNRLWRQFDAAGIPYTFHGGKMNNLNAQRVLDMYGAAPIEAWRNARHTLLATPELRRVFTNPFLREVGLDT